MWVSVWVDVNLSLAALPEFTGKFTKQKETNKKKNPGVCYRKAGSISNVEARRVESDSFGDAMRKTELSWKGVRAPPLPSLLSPRLPAFFIIDTSLLFDLCTPLFSASQVPRENGQQ